jgi:hypothetical protein
MKSVPFESVWSKTFTGKLYSPSLNNKENRFFASVALICLPFFLFFFFLAGLGGGQSIIERCAISSSERELKLQLPFLSDQKDWRVTSPPPYRPPPPKVIQPKF